VTDAAVLRWGFPLYVFVDVFNVVFTLFMVVNYLVGLLGRLRFFELLC
jgi:hypothetical protein